MIVGANGFTGRALVSFLRESCNDETTFCLLDKIADSTAGIIACDLLDIDTIAKCIVNMQPTQIYNLVGSFTNDYNQDYEMNVVATKNICEALITSGVRSRLLLVGSASEYGVAHQSENPISEQCPLRPQSIYGLTKAYQSMLMQYYHYANQLDIVMARTFNIYGLGISPRLFAGKIYKQIAEGSSEIILDDLSARRDYLHISEVVRYYQLIMDRGLSGEVYNVGSGISLNGQELSVKLIEEAGYKASAFTVIETGPRALVQEIYADLSKLSALKLA